MNEQERQAELGRLIAEQEADDIYFVRPERHSVSLETVGEYIGGNDTYFAGTEDEHYSFGDEANGIHSFLSPVKGEVLIEVEGDAWPWHGSPYGYRVKRCRCERCTEANKLYQRELRQRARTSSA